MGSNQRVFLLSAVAAVFLSLGLGGCDLGQGYFTRLSREWDALLIVLQGGTSPLAKKPQAEATPSQTTAPLTAAARAKQNAELLQEMIRVVYNREPSSPSEFGNLVDTLNQGASLEGLYNGFTHSSDYRKLEETFPGSAQPALILFSQELAAMELQLDQPTDFGKNAGQPLAQAEEPGLPENDPVSAVSFPGSGPGSAHAKKEAPAAMASPAKPDEKDLQRLYLAKFDIASIYTLKRVWADEALKLVDEKSREPKKLQEWYGAWVVHMASFGIDFGLPLRNRADAAFHAQWAATADPDMLRWEVLNRVHRTLNAMNAPKRAPVPSAAPSGPSSPEAAGGKS